MEVDVEGVDSVREVEIEDVDSVVEVEVEWEVEEERTNVVDVVGVVAVAVLVADAIVSDEVDVEEGPSAVQVLETVGYPLAE